jgi:Large polyvalent protein associated domain 29
LVVIPLDETCQRVRAELARRFPSTRFEVDTVRRAWMSWIVVAWESGPPVRLVREATMSFEGMRYDPAHDRMRRVYVTTHHEQGRESYVTYEPGSIVLHRRPARRPAGLDPEANED